MIDDIARIGDKVTIHIPRESWQGGYRPVGQPDGTPAVVTGFSEATYGRVHNFGVRPGVYVDKTWIRVMLEGGREYQEYHGRLELTDEQEAEKRVAEWRANGGSRLENKVFLRELPETKYWEGDHVYVRGFSGIPTVSAPYISDEALRAIQNGAVKPQLVVVGIDWQGEAHGQPRMYRVSDDFGAGWRASASEGSMELVKRGTVWEYFHGRKPEFARVEDEASFYMLLGHTDEVRNPATQLYSWTADELLDAVRNNLADGPVMGVVPGSVGDRRTISAIRFRDRELGERVRLATLKDWA